MISKAYLYILSALVLFTGCGEADYSLEQVSPTLQGKFLDDAVEGLEYQRSNGDEGVTTEGGYYDYKRLETISFSIGALTIGEARGASVITPRELAGVNNLIEDSKVNNRVRFMLALDSNDSRIGIQIDEAMRERARSWESEIDFAKNEVSFVSEVERVTHGDVSRLKTASQATEHFAKSLRCAYSGAYLGAWDVPDSNESSGFVGVMLQSNGNVMVMGDGQSVGDQNETMLYIEGRHNINTRSYTFESDKILYFDRSSGQVVEINSGGSIRGEGISTAYDSIDGSFTAGDQNGSYHVRRADSSDSAAYRYTGFGYELHPSVNADGDDIPIGMIMMDMDSDGQIYGLIHDMRNPMIQPVLRGYANFETGDVNIVVDMPEASEDLPNPPPDSNLSGRINFNNTGSSLRLLWHDTNGQVTYGTVVLDGCQLQALE